MVEGAGLEFRLRKIDEARNDLLYKTKHNGVMSEKYKTSCKYLNYVENLLILVSTITSCVSVSTFSSLADINVGITSSSIGINSCTIIAGVKKYKSMKKKKRKSMIE